VQNLQGSQPSEGVVPYIFRTCVRLIFALLLFSDGFQGEVSAVSGKKEKGRWSFL
jgi:hypothetical protein